MTDSLLRQRYIAAGLIHPNTKDLDPIQLNPGAIVFRINATPERRFMDRLRTFVDTYICPGASCLH